MTENNRCHQRRSKAEQGNHNQQTAFTGFIRQCGNNINTGGGSH
ncbi:hypothetical protein YPPY47_3022, partial [Yersinia pestis PY-47]